MRKIGKYPLIEPSDFLQRLLSYAKRQDPFILLNSNNYFVQYGKHEWIAAFGGEKIKLDHDAFHNLYDHWKQEKDWLFGYLGYDLKNQVEELESNNPDKLGFPDVFFFKPDVVIRYDQKNVFVESLKIRPQEVFDSILKEDLLPPHEWSGLELKPALTRKRYIECVEKLKEHIQRGNIYEVNFCQPFYGEDAHLDIPQMYYRFNSLTRAPFSSMISFEGFHAISGSPERYLAKRNNKIISQPIKGTARRSHDKDEDVEIKEELASSSKERAENIMIVDLVRNDLSRSALKNSVEVEELCGLYTFPTVHQLISTVVSEVNEDQNWGQVLRDTFPMGSMTGAPKVSAMKLIEEFEIFKRGLFSGAIGYIDPSGDFDFNVVIRTMLYNENTKCIEAPVGGAITIQSDPEKEYEECLVKIKALKDLLKK